MQTTFQMKAPKYGNNDDEIDEIGRKVMETPSFTQGKKRLENLPFVRGEIF
ncbi:hypothetical protein ES708_13604 [subsurface metagenome]